MCRRSAKPAACTPSAHGTAFAHSTTSATSRNVIIAKLFNGEDTSLEFCIFGKVIFVLTFQLPITKSNSEKNEHKKDKK